MDSNVMALIATAVAAGCLGLVVFLRAPDRPANRLFAVHAVCVTSWAWTMGALQMSDDPARVGLLLRLANLTGTLTLITFVDLIWVFPNRLRPAPPKRRAVLYGMGAVFGALVFLPRFITELRLTDTAPDVKFGWPLGLLSLYICVLMAHGNLVLIHKIRTLHGVSRVQTLYVAVGALVSEIIIFWVDFILPIWTGRTDYARWGAVAYSPTVTCFAVAIAKYRLWDLNSLTRRAAAAALATGSLAPVAALVVWVLGRIIQGLSTDPLRQAVVCVVSGAALGLFLVPAYNAFHGLVARPVEAERQRIGHLLSALGAAIVQAPPDGSALKPILAETQRFFGARLVEAYLRHPDDSFRSVGTVVPEGEAETSPRLPRRLPQSITEALGLRDLTRPLDAGQLARFGSVEETAPVLGAMDRLGASVIVPLLWERQMMGLLVVGDRLSRDMYYHSDIELLESVAAHAAIAVKSGELRAQIIAEKERTVKVLEQMESGVVAVDALHVIRLVNPAACALLGKQQGELVGRGLRGLPRVLRDRLQQAIQTGTLVSGEKVYLRTSRRPGERPLQLRVACSTFVLRAPGGVFEGAGIVFRDLSTEDALRQAEQETERLKFIRAVSAGMAHEIRNPLVAIRTFAELAPERLDDPEFRDSFLQVAQSEINRLEELVSHFMTLAKPTRTVREPVNLPGMIDSALTAVSARAQAERVTMRVRVAPSLPRPLGDEPRLYQALMNLLLNALDATPPGGEIEVRVYADGLPGLPWETQGHATVTGVSEFGPEGRTRGASSVVLEVWNSGSYIPPEDRERVFEPFFTNKLSGTGLGLAICQTIVDEHGGATEIESDREGGTSFLIRLPLTSVMAREVPEPAGVVVSS